MDARLDVRRPHGVQGGREPADDVGSGVVVNVGRLTGGPVRS